jgi:hypothetical protein
VDQQEIQSKLGGVYRRWKSQFDPKGLNLDEFSPPLLLAVTNDYCRAQMKIVVYGQETSGWGWNDRLHEEYPLYPTNWRFQNQNALRDFLANADAVDSLCWGYTQFDFARYQPISYRSPFWQAFREIQSWPGTGVMWANLVRSDYKGSQIFYADSKQKDAFLGQQSRLLIDELNVLRPNGCIFFTGPDYDSIIEAAFADVAFQQMDATPVRELARLQSASLPLYSYRTYHPSYLRQSRKWDHLAVIREAIMQSESRPAQANHS